jgi:hypothetical protein
VRRDGTPRTLCLDELTLRLAADWTRERFRRWPKTTNPHLLMTAQTAVDDSHPAISSAHLHRILRRIGVHASQLRMDRIFDEARATADPVHIMRLFAISAATAMRYVATAHPDRIVRRHG